jgi:hypothetical protein
MIGALTKAKVTKLGHWTHFTIRRFYDQVVKDDGPAKYKSLNVIFPLLFTVDSLLSY